MQYWSDFVESLDDANAFCKPRVLRRYQANLLDTGTFTVVSPHSGKKLEASGGNALFDSSATFPGQIAYLFPDRRDFWILTGSLYTAHPLAEVLVAGERQRHYLFPKRDQRTEAVPPKMEEQLRAASAVGGVDERTTLVIGHPNFAHNLWNELPALDLWLTGASETAIANLSIVASSEPFGPLREIFPRLSAATFPALPLDGVRGAIAAANRIVRVGSTLVTADVRQRVCNYCLGCPTSPFVDTLRECLRKAWPRVWLSVRNGSRTPENQGDFLLAIIARTCREFRNPAIVIDGFSYPVGFFDDPRTEKLRAAFSDRSIAAADAIASLQYRVARELGPSVASRVNSISGVTLTEAISIGALCDYYVCHSGTLQHKIGWVHRKPGFVHGHKLDRAAGIWYSRQVESCVAPEMLPESLAVRASEPKDVLKSNRPRNFNYRIVNVDKAADLVLSSMKSCLSNVSRHERSQGGWGWSGFRGWR